MVAFRFSSTFLTHLPFSLRPQSVTSMGLYNAIRTYVSTDNIARRI